MRRTVAGGAHRRLARGFTRTYRRAVDRAAPALPRRLRGWTTPIRSHFTPAPGIAYLDSATYGLPPEPTVRAIRAALEAWQAGTADWIVDWDRPAEAARSSFANLIGAADGGRLAHAGRLGRSRPDCGRARSGR